MKLNTTYHDTITHFIVCLITVLLWISTSLVFSGLLGAILMSMVCEPHIVLKVCFVTLAWFIGTVMLTSVVFIIVLLPMNMIDDLCERNWLRKHGDRFRETINKNFDDEFETESIIYNIHTDTDVHD